MSTTTTASPALSDFDSAQLEQYETTIKTGLASFIEVGEALTKIRDRKLYRATHGTFEEYCQSKWGMKKSKAYYLMDAAEVMSTIVDKSKITTESQARELARVEPAKRQEVVERAVADTGGKITAAALKEAAQTIEMVAAPADNLVPSMDGATPYSRWLNANFNKRKKTAPPSRTREELIVDFKYLFERCVRHNYTHDDLKIIPSLLVEAWRGVLADEADYQAELATRCHAMKGTNAR